MSRQKSVRDTISTSQILILIFFLIGFVVTEENDTDKQQIKNDIMCNDVSSSAYFAAQRAKTKACRDQLMFDGCVVSQTHFLPEKLPNSCTIKSKHKAGQLMGCFDVAKNSSTLPYRHGRLFHANNSPDTCIAHCYKHGFPFAGVMNGYECYCSEWQTHRIDGPLAMHHCAEIPCPGNLTMACGSEYSILVYRTGLANINIRDFRDYENLSKVLSKQSQAGMEPVRIAFMMNIGGRSARQFRRMLNMLYSPEHYYYIHVDSRNDYLYRELIGIEQIVPNVKLKKRRFPTVWGGFGMFYTFLDEMRELFEMFSKWKWDFVTNLSESDFPLLTVEEFAAYLSKHKEKNFMDFGHSFLDRYGRTTILDDLHSECDEMVRRIGVRKMPRNIHFEGGQDYFTLGRSFLQYVVYGSDPFILGMKKHYNFTVIPLEHFFQTLLLNSPFCTSIMGHPLRYVSFHLEKAATCRCMKSNLDFCACSPWVIQDFDWSKVNRATALHHMFFIGRKFDPVINQAVIAGIELGTLEVYTDNELLTNSYKFVDLPAASSGQNYSSNIEDRTNLPGFHSYWYNDFHFMDKLTEPSPAKVSLMNALARLSIVLLDNYTSVLTFACKSPSHWSPICCSDKERKLRILGLNFARHGDRKSRLLVLWRLSCRSPFTKTFVYLEAEAEFGRMGKRRIFDPLKRLADLELGSNFDRNEGIFRNYAGAIGSSDIVSLKHEWNDGLALWVDVEFVDPYNETREIIKAAVGYIGRTVVTEFSGFPSDEANLTVYSDHHAYGFLYPPGLWTAKVYGNKELVGELEFPVFPDSKPLGKLPVQPLERLPLWTKDGRFLHPKPPELREQFSETARNVMSDAMAKLFYKPLNICFHYNSDHNIAQSANKATIIHKTPSYKILYRNIPECVESSWSSRSPDPKSEFNPNLKLNLV